MSRTEKKKKRAPERGRLHTLPVLPLTDLSPLPGLVIPVYLSEKKSFRAVEYALEEGLNVVLSLQKGSSDKPATKDNLSRIAGLAVILQSVELPNGDFQISFHVLHRARIRSFSSFSSIIKARVEYLQEPKSIKLSKHDEELVNQVKEKMEVLRKYESSVEEHFDTISELYNPGGLADLVGSVMTLDEAEAQRIMEELDGKKRLRLVADLADAQIDALAIKERISKKAEEEVSSEHHQELLREQLRLIKAELGESFDYEDELSDLKKQLRDVKMPAAARREAEKQFRRLQQLHPDTSEAALVRTYLDWIMDLPWSKRTKDRLDLAVAKEILDQDHYGLEKTKERILDFLGVRKLRKETRGPILLFVGPPGVGKTSLGRSIARALGREFVRMSLGGLRDEAELRGHRRTYVGALPGRIIQGLKTVGVRNPVFMLDELDKIGSDFRGDPASVLLEVLDPEQNSAFEDHYLNIPFDLSEVLFIGTANITDSIPPALHDRMEVIEINGYTPKEKLQISKRFLVPQELEENGLTNSDIKISDQSLLHIVTGYTRESGVRQLRRCISTVFRKIARIIAEGGRPPSHISPKMVQKHLGPVLYIPDRRLRVDEVGVVAGLAWTEVGGEILTVEVSITKGKSQLSLTGQLGDVMRESAMTALTYVLSKADDLGIDPGFYEKSNVHVHVPQGAIPKDGPSAGIAIATALVSVLTGKPVARRSAMTGEITLRGSVLPVGGLREKALAALRAGMDKVIIPKENERELVEFPKYLRDALSFLPVHSVDQVFEVALLPKTEGNAVEKKPTVRKPIVRSQKLAQP